MCPKIEQFLLCRQYGVVEETRGLHPRRRPQSSQSQDSLAFLSPNLLHRLEEVDGGCFPIRRSLIRISDIEQG